MLRRVRRSGLSLGFRVPRRGRIRAVLLLGVVAFVVAAVLQGRNAPARPGAEGRSDVAPAEAKPSDDPVKATAEVLPPPVLGLGREEVAALLRRHPPKLWHARDTLRLSGRSIVFHYSAHPTAAMDDGCAECHRANAQKDMVFTQFYPILR